MLARGGLLFLVDTGADVSLFEGNKLVGTTEFSPEGKIEIKCVDSSTIETHGVIEAKIRLGSKSVTQSFQLVSKLDIPCDGIVGRDFFSAPGLKSAETGIVILYGEMYEMIGEAEQLGERGVTAAQITLPDQRALCGFQWHRDRPR